MDNEVEVKPTDLDAAHLQAVTRKALAEARLINAQADELEMLNESRRQLRS